MTSGEQEIRARLSAVEHEAAAARKLAAAAYEEVGTLAAGVRANTSLLNALRETQMEHGLRLTGLEGRMGGLEGLMGGLEGRMDGLEGRMGGLEGRMGGLEGRMGGFEGLMGGLEGRMGGLESEVRSGFATMSQGMATIVTMLGRLSPEQ